MLDLSEAVLKRAAHAYALTQGPHTQKLKAAILSAPPNQPALPDFEAAMRCYDDTYADRDPQLHAARRAAYAAMWFIENVGDDVPDRSDVFFAVREIGRAAQ